MSGKLNDLVWDHPTVKGTEKLLLLKLADWSNDEGHLMYPTSPGALAERVGVEERRLRQMLRGFEGKGWIAVTHAGDKGGRGVRHTLLSVDLQLGTLFPGYVPKLGTERGKKPGTSLPSNATKPGSMIPGISETRKSDVGNSEIQGQAPHISNQSFNKDTTNPSRAEAPPISIVAESEPTQPRGHGHGATAKARAGAAPIPDDWVPPPGELLKMAVECPLINLERETAQIIDWAKSKGEKRADWDATWRKCLRSAQKDAERDAAREGTAVPRSPHTNGHRSSPPTAVLPTPEEYDAAIAAAEASENGWGI